MFFPHRFKKLRPKPLNDITKEKVIEFEGQMYSADDIIEMVLNDPDKYMRLETTKKKAFLKKEIR